MHPARMSGLHAALQKFKFAYAAKSVLGALAAKKLKAANIEKIEAGYDACGDSGNVDDIHYRRKEGSLTRTLHDVHKPDQNDTSESIFPYEEVQDFLWSVVYDLHPGFEINEGGYGDICWDIETDKIDVNHEERIEMTNSYVHEGI